VLKKRVNKNGVNQQIINIDKTHGGTDWFIESPLFKQAIGENFTV
jgi:hypothetical protein